MQAYFITESFLLDGRYVSRMSRTENILSQKIFEVFLKTIFIYVSCYPVHY